jgi:hypothetical protein
MVNEVEIVHLPAWVEHLRTGGPLPPEPDGGWSRWWGEYDGYVWLIIIAGAIGLAYHIFGEAATAAIRKAAE